MSIPVPNSAAWAGLSLKRQLEQLRTLPALQQLDLLLNSPHGGALVRHMPSHELYLLLREVGLEDAQEVLGLAAPSQFESFLDMDCWKRDRINLACMGRWLENLLEGADEQAVLDIVRALDFELLLLFFGRCLSAPEEEKAENPPDFPPEMFKVGERLLALVEEQDPELFQQLALSLNADTFASLEESAYQRHRTRQWEAGFPDFMDAQIVYTRLNPDQVTADADFCATDLSKQNDRLLYLPELAANAKEAVWLQEVLDGREAELAALVNRVLVADERDIGDRDTLRAALQEVRDYLHLGGEYLRARHGSEWAALWPHLPLLTLFRAGFSLTLRLHDRALRLAKSDTAFLLDDVWQRPLAELKKRKPQFLPPELETPRGFRSLDELERANGWLDEAEVAEKLFEGPLRFDLSSWQPVDASKHPLPAPLMSRIFLTALANRLLGGKLAPRPIPASKLGALHRMITLDGHLHPRLREETVNWLESLVPGGGRFAQFCLRQWDESFCPITPDKMDPRFVGGLLIAPDTD